MRVRSYDKIEFGVFSYRKRHRARQSGKSHIHDDCFYAAKRRRNNAFFGFCQRFGGHACCWVFPANVPSFCITKCLTNGPMLSRPEFSDKLPHLRNGECSDEESNEWRKR